ncbi:MAG: SDR family oxidoreductase [Micropepsaceae bacterium]
MIDYAGKAVLVTGGASGIGLAMARAFRARGAKLVLADISAEGLKEVATEFGSDAVTKHCDLADANAPQDLIAEAFRAFGRLDVVCSNAGIGHNKKILKEPIGDAVNRLFNINLFAGLRIAQAFHALLVSEGRQGHLLLTGSENSLSVPSAVRGSGLGMYAATKHGLLIAAEWLRDEIAGGPLSVHVLMPGAVYTPLIARVLPDPSKAPPSLDLIMPERCAEIALRGLDLGLFYIPTQKHLAQDMAARTKGVTDALKALGVT